MKIEIENNILFNRLTNNLKCLYYDQKLTWWCLTVEAFKNELDSLESKIKNDYLSKKSSNFIKRAVDLRLFIQLLEVELDEINKIHSKHLNACQNGGSEKV